MQVDLIDVGSISGSGRSPGGGQDNPLQYSCVENPRDRGAWWATVHRIAQSRTLLRRLSTHAHTFGQLDVTDTVPTTVKLMLQFSILQSLKRLTDNTKATFQSNWILQEKNTQGN